jgi:hypothetical protein
VSEIDLCCECRRREANSYYVNQLGTGVCLTCIVNDADLKDIEFEEMEALRKLQRRRRQRRLEELRRPLGRAK